MKKQILAAAAAAFLLLPFAAQADDDTPFETFAGFIYFCAPQLPPVDVEQLPDGSVRVTFINDGNVWVTGNPLIDGEAENTTVATFAPDGSADVRQRGSVEVTEGGTWKWRQRILIAVDGTAAGYGIGFGRGELRGRLMFFQTGTIRVDLTETPCGIPAGAPIAGTILGVDADD